MNRKEKAGSRVSMALVVSALIAAGIPTGALAQVMQFTHTGSGSGTLDGVPFPMSDFVITSLADASYRQSVGHDVLFINHTSSSISIAGVGTFDILTQTRTFVNKGSNMVGFSRGGIHSGLDLFLGPHDDVFGSWDMTTPIAQVSELGQLRQWGSCTPWINTTGGILIFDDTPGWVPSTFTAIPEPAALSLLAIGGFALIRRRRQG